MAKGNNESMWRKSLVVTFILIFLGFGLVFINLFRWQVVRGEELKIKAVDQSLRSTELTAARGKIYDATGTKILAQSASVWTVVLEPAFLKDNEELRRTVSNGLAEILDMDAEAIYEKTGQNSYFTYLKRRVEIDVRDAILEFKKENKIGSGIRLLDDYKRYYQYGTVASTVLGFTGAEGQGLSGLELEYDDELSGVAGRMINAKNALGTDMPFQYQQMVDAEDGYDLVLTIDEVVQSTMEKKLKEGIERYNVANGATGILMDVDTGSIIGLASAGKGYFDPNDPFTIYDSAVQEEIDRLPEDEQDQAYSDALNQQWRNKAVSDLYIPGSVYKMCVGAMGLEEGVISEDTTFYCGGSIIFDGLDRPISCWQHSGHGSETFIDGLCNSCNPYFIQIGQLLGTRTFSKYRKAFGFQETTGIDLPGEAWPLYHSEETMSISDLAVESFGQNFKVTPVQMITAAATMANGGNLVRPHVVDRILDSEGNIVKTADTSYKRQVVSEETAKKIAEILYKNATEGTAMNGYVQGYRVSGKTGTSEKVDEYNENPEAGMRYIASYCGFAPIENPRYVLLVYFDEPMGALTGGNAVAGPIFSEIMEEVLPYLGIESKYTEEEYTDLNKSAPDVVGLTLAEAYEKLNADGLSSTVVGADDSSEIITEQIPLVGQEMPKDGKVILYTSGYGEILYTEVPDFSGLSLTDTQYVASQSGLQIVASGGTATKIGVAQTQSTLPGERIKTGSVITVSFIDASVNDLVG